MTLRYGDGNEVLSGDTVQYTDPNGDRKLDHRFTVGRDPLRYSKERLIPATDNSLWVYRALQDMTLVSRKDATEPLPEPDWTKPIESFKPKKNGYVVARKDGGNGGKWVDPFSATWCFEPAEHDHHVSSFVACGLRAVAAGVAPCGCRQTIDETWINNIPCHSHGGPYTYTRRRVADEITGYTPLPQFRYSDGQEVRVGDVYETNGNLRVEVLGIEARKVTVVVVGDEMILSTGEWKCSNGRRLITRAGDALTSSKSDHVHPTTTKPTWDDIRPGQVWRFRNGLFWRAQEQAHSSLWLLDPGGVRMTRAEFDAGDWTLVSDVEPRDTIPCPQAETADLQPGIPGEPTYADHRRRYLDAMLRGERVHDSVCACWHCMGCDAGRWSPWDKAEAERKIALAEMAAKVVGYSLWTWGSGGRTEGDRE